MSSDEKDWGSLEAIEGSIRDSPNPYAGVGELAAKIARLINEGGNRAELTEYFHRIADSHALEASPDRHVKYARRLISSNVRMFEEVFKVFALLNELEAMKMLGLAPSEVLEAELKREFRNWSSKSPVDVRRVANIVNDSWSHNAWFFQVLRE